MTQLFQTTQRWPMDSIIDQVGARDHFEAIVTVLKLATNDQADAIIRVIYIQRDLMIQNVAEDTY